MSEYRDKLRTLGFSTRRGTTRVRPVLSEETGEQVGHATDHWSGRTDATATKFEVKVNPALRVERVSDGNV